MSLKQKKILNCEKIFNLNINLKLENYVLDNGVKNLFRIL